MLLTTPREVGAYIRDRRKSAGMTQHDLALANDVSTRWLIDVEAGKPGAQLGLVLGVLRSLGVTLDASQSAPDPPPPASDIGADIAISAVTNALSNFGPAS